MKGIIGKWWFWTIILALVVYISIFLGMHLKTKIEDIQEVSSSIRNIDNQALIYTSTDKKTIIIELSNGNKQMREQIEKKITEFIGKGKKLQYYTYLIEYIPTEHENVSYLVKKVYKLPSMIQDTSKEKIYQEV